MYIEGRSTVEIAEILTKEGVPTPMKKFQWRSNTVQSILSNEKYHGDALLQKTFSFDYKTKKAVKNTGQIPQYYISNSHPAIIDEDTFELVQMLVEERSAKRSLLSRTGEMSTKIICGDCGKYLGRKSFQRASGPVTYWRCNNKYEGHTCQIPDLSEDYIRAAFIKALNIHLDNREKQIQEALIRITGLKESRADNKEDVKKSRCELEQAAEKYNSSTSESTEPELLKKYSEELSRAEKRYHTKRRAYLKGVAEISILTCYVDCLRGIKGTVETYDPELFRRTIAKVIVKNTGKLAFYFVNGSKVTV